MKIINLYHLIDHYTAYFYAKMDVSGLVWKFRDVAQIHERIENLSSSYQFPSYTNFSALSALVHLQNDTFQVAVDSRAAEKMSTPRAVHSKNVQNRVYSLLHCFYLFHFACLRNAFQGECHRQSSF